MFRSLPLILGLPEAPEAPSQSYPAAPTSPGAVLLDRRSHPRLTARHARFSSGVNCNMWNLRIIPDKRSNSGNNVAVSSSPQAGYPHPITSLDRHDTFMD